MKYQFPGEIKFRFKSCEKKKKLYTYLLPVNDLKRISTGFFKAKMAK